MLVLCMLLLQCSSHTGFVAVATITKIQGKAGIGYRVQIRKFKNGRIVYSEAKTFPKKTLAEKWGAKREAELAEPGALERAGSSHIRVIDLINMYLRDFCASAGRTKLADLKTLKKYEFAQLPIDRLSAETLIDHIRERLKTVKPQTALNDFVWLRNVYNAAYPAWGIKVTTHEIDAAKNFCASKGMVHKSTERDRRPTADELDRLSEHFKNRDGRAQIPMYDIMWFAIESSRRQAEITRLRWDDNDNKNQTGMVRDIKHPRKKGLNKRFKYTDAAWEIVQRQPKTSEFIFPYNAKSVGSAFTRACHLLEIDDLHFHDTRHEATSRLFEAGYSIPQVQLFTLHESWAVLKTYTNLRPENLKTLP
jgi:integrase